MQDQPVSGPDTRTRMPNTQMMFLWKKAVQIPVMMRNMHLTITRIPWRLHWRLCLANAMRLIAMAVKNLMQLHSTQLFAPTVTTRTLLTFLGILRILHTTNENAAHVWHSCAILRPNQVSKTSKTLFVQRTTRVQTTKLTVVTRKLRLSKHHHLCSRRQ